MFRTEQMDAKGLRVRDHNFSVKLDGVESLYTMLLKIKPPLVKKIWSKSGGGLIFLKISQNLIKRVLFFSGASRPKKT